MQLFKVPAGKRVRITSKLVRWVEHGVEHTIIENVTWTGTTTKHYYFFKGYRRRMLTNHDMDWPELCIWQRDTDQCEVIN